MRRYRAKGAKMEIQNNLSNASNIIVSKPSRENLGDDEKTGLERVSEAIEQGRQMREAISGNDEDDKKESSAGSSGKSELTKSIEKMIKVLEKQIKALMSQLSKTDDMEQKQALQSQINALQSQVMKMQAQLLELGGDVLSIEA